MSHAAGSIIVELEAEGGSIRFVRESPDTDWVACWLCTPHGDRRLGAESFEVLAWRLGSRLTGELSDASGQIDGDDAYWAFSLADGHSTLYYINSDDGMVFVWQAADGQLLGDRLLLSRDRRRQWQSQLNAALSSFL